MDLVLDPPHGAAPILLGMTFDEALAEDGTRITAIELWSPGEGRTSTTRVLLDGDEVFTTPAAALFHRATERGWTVDTSQPEYPVTRRST